MTAAGPSVVSIRRMFENEIFNRDQRRARAPGARSIALAASCPDHVFAGECGERARADRRVRLELGRPSGAAWVSDESSSMQVVYTPSGSAQGRTDFANGQNDFAISDIGIRGAEQADGSQRLIQPPVCLPPDLLAERRRSPTTSWSRDSGSRTFASQA